MNFYYTDEAGAVAGPVAREQLQKLVDSGLVAADGQACFEGSEDWKPLSTFVRPTPKPTAAAPAAKPAQRAATTTTPKPAATPSTGVSPWIIVVAILLMVAAIWQMMESANAAAEALAELNAANREVSDSLARQIHNIKTMTDAQDALAKSTDELGEARKKLAQMEVDKADKNQRKAQAEHIKDLERQRKQLKKNMKASLR